jgi:signal transduction histidine kinase
VVQDNGKGFDAANIDTERRNMGLVGLKERAQLLNGEFSVDSKVGEGTTIRVSIPISKNT